MEQGCRSVVAARWGVSEWEAEGRRGRAATRPVLEVRDGAWRRGDWVLTAAYAVDLPLAVSRFVEARRRVQELPPGTADYEDKVHLLEARLAIMRACHGREAVSLALLRADAAEARALLPEGFDVSPPERVFQELPRPRAAGAGPAPSASCRLSVPGLAGTLHEGALYHVDLYVHQDYPSKDPIGTTGPALLTHHLLMALLPSEKVFHPNLYPNSGRLCFHGLLEAARCWDASCSLSEVLLHVCFGLHHMQLADPSHGEAYVAAQRRHLFVDFQMRVREMAETAAVVPPPPPLPAELRAALLEAPLDAKFRSVQLGCRTLRLQAPADANGWQRLS